MTEWAKRKKGHLVYHAMPYLQNGQERHGCRLLRDHASAHVTHEDPRLFQHGQRTNPALKCDGVVLLPASVRPTPIISHNVISLNNTANTLRNVHERTHLVTETTP